MRIKIIGDCESARALRGLLRKAGFAVVEFLPAEVVAALPGGGYVVEIEEGEAGRPGIYFDSIDSELEANILRHTAALSPLPVTVDRPGGKVRSDREIRIVVPAGNVREQAAVEYGVLRGLMDTIHGTEKPAGKPPIPWWRRVFLRSRRPTPTWPESST